MQSLCKALSAVSVLSAVTCGQTVENQITTKPVFESVVDSGAASSLLQRAGRHNASGGQNGKKSGHSTADTDLADSLKKKPEESAFSSGNVVLYVCSFVVVFAVCYAFYNAIEVNKQVTLKVAKDIKQPMATSQKKVDIEQ